jgi:hypothetical protein
MPQKMACTRKRGNPKVRTSGSRYRKTSIGRGIIGLFGRA